MLEREKCLHGNVELSFKHSFHEGFSNKYKNGMETTHEKTYI